jgi:WD40 repeat protein
VNKFVLKGHIMDATNDDNPRDFGELAEKILSHSKNDVETLITLAKGEETEWLEFKAALYKSKEFPLKPNENDVDLLFNVAKAVIAMANSQGGVVLIGVSDKPKPSEPVGLTYSDPNEVLKNEGIEAFHRKVVRHAIQKKKWETKKATWVLNKVAALDLYYKFKFCSWKKEYVTAIIVTPVPKSEDFLYIEEKSTDHEILLIRSKGDIGMVRQIKKCTEINEYGKMRDSGISEWVNLWHTFLKNTKLDFVSQPVTFDQLKERYHIVYKEVYPDYITELDEKILPDIDAKDMSIGKQGLGTDTNRPHIEEDRLESQDTANLFNAIEQIWDTPARWHCVLVADGGMGKTTSLLKLWADLLANYEDAPMSIYIRLDDYNREYKKNAGGLDLNNFIWNNIATDFMNYHPPLNHEVMTNIKNYFSQRLDKNGKLYPQAIIMLDGFNEVTVDNSILEECINDLLKLKGTQLIISSRYDMRNKYSWNQFSKFTLKPLRKKQIDNYLSFHGINLTDDIFKTNSVLEKPMMLTMFSGHEREIKERNNSSFYSFFQKPLYTAEIFHNYIEATISRHNRSGAITQADNVINRLFLKNLLSKIGYEMEKKGILEISRTDLKNLIKQEFAYYSSDEFLNPDRNNWFEDCFSKIEQSLTDERDNILTPIKTFVEEFYLLRENTSKSGGRTNTESAYEFVHQDFRDYFAAEYIIEMLIMHKENFAGLKERIFKPNLRKMIGELACEPRRRPIIDDNYQPGDVNERTMDNILDSLRDKVIEHNDYSLLNIIEILKDTRVDLSDTHLNRLDLRRIVFNNVRLGHGKTGSGYIGADFTESRIKPYNFLPNHHFGSVNAVRYCPDGDKFLSAGEDKSIKEWDVITGECLRIYKKHDQGITSVDYRQDGKRFISGSGDKTVMEWDVETGELLQIYAGHEVAVTSVSYSKDGKDIISGDENGIIKEWQSGTQDCLYTHDAHLDYITTIVCSPCGKYFISGSLDETIQQWDIEEHACVNIFDNLSGVSAIACRQDGKKILAGDEKGNLLEWDVLNESYNEKYDGHSDEITGVCYDLSGERAFSSTGLNNSDIPELKIWDCKTGSCIKTIKEGKINDGINSIHCHEKGKRVIAGKNYGIMEWDVTSGECIRNIKNRLTNICFVKFSDDGNQIITGNTNGEIKNWDTTTGKCQKTYKLVQLDKAWIDLSPDTQKVISIDFNGRIQEWDIYSGQLLKTYPGYSPQEDAAFTIKYSHDGEKVFSSYGNIIKVWDVSTANCINSLALRKFVFNENIKDKLKGKLPEEKLKSITNLYGIKFFEEILKNKLKDLCFQNDEIDLILKNADEDIKYNITSIDYTIDDNRIIFGIKNEYVNEWDLETGKHYKSYEYSDAFDVKSICYCPNGRNIASCNSKVINEWNLETGDLTENYCGHKSVVSSISYSQDGQKLVSGSKNNTIKIWDVNSKKCLLTINDIFGLYIQGVTMTKSKIPGSDIGLLQQFGALIV